MPVDKKAPIRMQIIDRMVSGKRKTYPTHEELRSACEDRIYGTTNGKHISKSTIEKDIRFMRDKYDAPLKYIPIKKGYTYTEEGFSIALTEDEYESIHMASRVLDQLKDTEIFEDFEAVVDKIMERIELSYSLPNKDKREYVQFETAPKMKGTEHLGDLLHAIKNKRTVRLEYQKFNDTKVTQRKLDPYLLKEYRNRWYVVGWDHDDKIFKTFGLERISDLILLLDHFDLNSRFNLYKYYKHNVGITTVQQAPEKVVIETSVMQADYLNSQPIHWSQKETNRNNDKVVFEMEVVITIELKMILLGMGKEVVVIEPHTLVTEMKGIIKETLKSYNS